MSSLLDAYRLLKEGTQQTTGDTSMPQAGPEKDICPVCEKKKCECDSVDEALSPKQKKIAKLAGNPNEIDAEDLKKLRKEDTKPPFDGPYTSSFKKAKNPNRTGMDAARALSKRFLEKSKNTPVIVGHEKYTSAPDKLKQQHFGMSEEVEQLEEANHRDFASVGMMHPDMAKHMNVGDHMDYYEPKTGDKVHGKVMHKSDKEVHMKQSHDSYDSKKVGSVHKFKISSSLPDAEMKEEVQQVQEVLSVNMGVSKWISDFVHSTNPKFKGKSVKERQKMALGAFYAAKKGVKEDYSWIYEGEQLDEISKATIGSYVKKASDDAIISRKIATDFENRAKTSRKQDMKDANTNVANDFKNKSWKRQDNIKKAVDRLTKEEVEQIEEGDLTIRHLYNKFADAQAGGHDTKPTEKAIRKVHGDKVMAHMMKASKANAKGDFDGEQRHFDNAQTAGRKTDRLGSTVGTGRSAFRKRFEEVEIEESSHNVAATVHTQNYTWGKMKTIHQGHDFSIPLHPEHHEAIAKLEDQQEHHFKDETGRHWTAKRNGNDVHFQGANGGNSTTVSHQSMKEENMKSFKDFITEMEFVNGKYVHKGKYGTSYDDPEGKEDSEKPAAEKAEKRGRGRPAGAKSGARQIGGASKKGSGVEYTGYKLHLPNSNKSY